VTAPTIVDQNIVVGDLEGYVHWISRYDGHFVARINVGDAPIVSKPIVSNDLLYVINTDGKLTAFQVR
jgi:outer membrane protein assembly factor BamB